MGIHIVTQSTSTIGQTQAIGAQVMTGRADRSKVESSLASMDAVATDTVPGGLQKTEKTNHVEQQQKIGPIEVDRSLGIRGLHFLDNSDWNRSDVMS